MKVYVMHFNLSKTLSYILGHVLHARLVPRRAAQRRLATFFIIVKYFLFALAFGSRSAVAVTVIFVIIFLDNFHTLQKYLVLKSILGNNFLGYKFILSFFCFPTKSYKILQNPTFL